MRKYHRKEKGQSLTEFALSMTILLILLAGIVDLGRAFFTFIALRDAVQEGAIFGSTHPTATEEIKNHVTNSSDMVQGLITNADVTVQVIGSPCAGSGIRVGVTYSGFQITMPFIGTFLGTQNIPISATVTDTILMPACS
jgi:Flp pilus assembly protein TadG